MNFYNQFLDSWNSRFDCVFVPTVLECLKADQFSSLHEQKLAIEFQYSKTCSVIDELKEQLNRENFTADFLQKCVQKLGAVSQVFNEIDSSDSKWELYDIKSSTSSGAGNRHTGSCASPNPSMNGSGFLQNSKLLTPTNVTLPLLSQCITSSLMQSASPLLVAAAATSSSPFVLPSNLSHFPPSDSIK